MSNEQIYDLIIIGGGPAGMSAGIYSARAGYKTLLVEKMTFGGQMVITSFIDNYPGFPEGISGFELQERMYNQMKKYGVEVKNEDVKEINQNKDGFTVTTSSESYQSHAAIIATGF